MNVSSYAMSLSALPATVLVRLAQTAIEKVAEGRDTDGMAKVRLACLEVEADIRGWSLRTVVAKKMASQVR